MKCTEVLPILEAMLDDEAQSDETGVSNTWKGVERANRIGLIIKSCGSGFMTFAITSKYRRH